MYSGGYEAFMPMTPEKLLETYKLWNSPKLTRPVFRQCDACGKAWSKDKPTMQCAGCRDRYYCDRECQNAAWARHKRTFCKYIKACRRTTQHDAIIIPADGGPAYLRKLDFSVEAACFPKALYLRAPDVRDTFGSEVTATRVHMIDAEDEADNGAYYAVHYNMSTQLPPNRHLLRALGMDDVPRGRPFWHGDVVIVKLFEAWEHRPKHIDQMGGGAEVDFFDAKLSFLITLQKYWSKFYETGFQRELNQDRISERYDARIKAAGSYDVARTARASSDPALD